MSAKSISTMSSSGIIPSKAVLAMSFLLAGTITLAPHSVKALVVSRPMPE